MAFFKNLNFNKKRLFLITGCDVFQADTLRATNCSCFAQGYSGRWTLYYFLTQCDDKICFSLNSLNYNFRKTFVISVIYGKLLSVSAPVRSRRVQFVGHCHRSEPPDFSSGDVISRCTGVCVAILKKFTYCTISVSLEKFCRIKNEKKTQKTNWFSQASSQPFYLLQILK